MIFDGWLFNLDFRSRNLVDLQSTGGSLVGASALVLGSLLTFAFESPINP